MQRAERHGDTCVPTPARRSAIGDRTPGASKCAVLEQHPWQRVTHTVGAGGRARREFRPARFRPCGRCSSRLIGIDVGM